MSKHVPIIYAVERELPDGTADRASSSRRNGFYTRLHDAEVCAKKWQKRGNYNVVAYRLTRMVLN